MESHKTYIRSRAQRKRESEPAPPGADALLRLPDGKTMKVSIVEESDSVIASMPRQQAKPNTSERKIAACRENGRLGGRPSRSEAAQPVPAPAGDAEPVRYRQPELVPVKAMVRLGVWEGYPFASGPLGHLAKVPGFPADQAFLVTDNHALPNIRPGSIIGVRLGAPLTDGALVLVQRLDDLDRRELTVRRLGFDDAGASIVYLPQGPRFAAQFVWPKDYMAELLACEPIAFEGGKLQILGTVTITTRIEE